MVKKSFKPKRNSSQGGKHCTEWDSQENQSALAKCWRHSKQSLGTVMKIQVGPEDERGMESKFRRQMALKITDT